MKGAEGQGARRALSFAFRGLIRAAMALPLGWEANPASRLRFVQREILKNKNNSLINNKF